MNGCSFIGRTDPGLQRDQNEDTFLCSPVWDRQSMLLCAAIDGVGGYEGGEVASAMVAETVLSYVQSNKDGKPLDVVKRALLEANNAVYLKRSSSKHLSRMGCVASVSLVDTECMMAYVAHVGDSRIYLMGDNDLRKITHDHSLVGYMEDNEDITEFQAMNHPQRNEIDRCLGDSFREYDKEDGFVESGIYPIPDGGKLLLCTDGLTDLVTSREIFAILSSKDSTDQKVDSLISAANAKGGKDNVTSVLVEFPPKKVVSMEERVELPDNEENNKNEDVFSRVRSGSAGSKYGWMIPAICMAAGVLLGFFLGRRTVELPNKSSMVSSTVMVDDSLRLHREVKEEYLLLRDGIGDTFARLSKVLEEKDGQVDSLKGRIDSLSALLRSSQE